MGGGPALRQLETLRLDWPIGLHGVGMSLGTACGLEAAHLGRFQALVERIEPALIRASIFPMRPGLADNANEQRNPVGKTVRIVRRDVADPPLPQVSRP